MQLVSVAIIEAAVQDHEEQHNGYPKQQMSADPRDGFVAIYPFVHMQIYFLRPTEFPARTNNVHLNTISSELPTKGTLEGI